jgi:hypothetical protein
VTFSAAGADDDLRAADLERQVDARQKRGDELMAGARAIMRMRPSRQGRSRAEQAARQALASYASALDWAEDTDNEDEAGCFIHLRGRRRSEDAGGSGLSPGGRYDHHNPVDRHRRVRRPAVDTGYATQRLRRERWSSDALPEDRGGGALDGDPDRAAHAVPHVPVPGRVSTVGRRRRSSSAHR